VIEVPSLVYAFSVGMAAAFNPCGAAVFPAYVGYQLGVIELGVNRVSLIFRALMFGLAATSGFIFTFGSVGLLLAIGGSLIGQFLPFAGLIVGVAIFSIGLWLLLSGGHLGFAAASRVNLGQGRGLKNIFLFGIGYAVASLSCALPLFLISVGIGASKTLNISDFLVTITHTITYGLGMGVVIIIVTIGVIFFNQAIYRWLRFVFKYIDLLGKIGMILAGIYVMHYWILGDGKSVMLWRFDQLF